MKLSNLLHTAKNKKWLFLFLALNSLIMAATLIKLNEKTNLALKAASCPATSYLSFTNAAGQTVTAAGNGNTISAHLYVTGLLDAADLVLGYNFNKLRFKSVQLKNMGSFTHRPGSGAVDYSGTPGVNRLLLMLKREPGTIAAAAGEVAKIEFAVVTDEGTTAQIIYGGRTTFARQGTAGRSECGQTAVLTLNGGIPPASTPTPLPSPTPTPTPATFSNANEFREYIFQNFGFTGSAKDLIRNTSTIEVENFNSTSGGGGWYPDVRVVRLLTAQYEAAVHELSHVWWHSYRNVEKILPLVRDVVRLADGDGPPAAVNFARGYVYGIGDWPGMYCTNYGCADLHDIGEDDLAKIIDWEIYAGFSSWTMGKFKNGSHVLPSYLWPYFQPEFTGTISLTPYYEGGHP